MGNVWSIGVSVCAGSKIKLVSSRLADQLRRCRLLFFNSIRAKRKFISLSNHVNSNIYNTVFKQRMLYIFRKRNETPTFLSLVDLDFDLS